MPVTGNAARVIVFAKAPRPGSAKTRLIPLLGAEGAAALHARLIEHTLATARSAGIGPVELHGTPANDDFLRECASRHAVALVEQCEGGLGERMHGAFEDALGETRPVLLIGSDCPALTAGHLRRAAHALCEGHDAVFVPTDDGGYALIGLTRAHARLFAGIAWSTPAVMRETRARLTEIGWQWAELETLWDVDRPEDYARLRESGLLSAGATFDRA
ncbi:MAG TPA: TIGR04282 family arsenosugar biosynthesis glycosyltransferase [Burkholderiales bacterium]|nr:TIGR04282 family arsenosugar biosynthesis glycosyltransferase [Burkholderiales bacterium]